MLLLNFDNNLVLICANDWDNVVLRIILFENFLFWTNYVSLIIIVVAIMQYREILGKGAFKTVYPF